MNNLEKYGNEFLITYRSGDSYYGELDECGYGVNNYFFSCDKKQKTKEEIVLKLLKGDFEKNNGITFEDFIETYNKILENSPEKLI